MPTYSYSCDACDANFELFFYIKDYTDKPKCPSCNSRSTYRLYALDALTQSSSVKKSDSELKTLGDLALRNTEKMSNDQKHHLYNKHNAYKEKTSDKELPKGMSRIKKPPRPKWPGESTPKLKRKPKR